MTRQRGLLYSNACKYAVQAMVYLARHPEGATAPRIAGECNLMPYTLANVLRELAAHGILSSTKGVNGGFRLRRRAVEIRLADVVEAVDGKRVARAAPSPETRLPTWRELRRAIHSFLTQTTIAQLARAADRLQTARAHSAAE
jgi:Rrf2 family protein